MEVDFVPYQEALELHNIGAIFANVGFPHFAIYRNGNLSFANQDAIQMFVEDFKDEVIVAPLYQQAFRWLYQQLDIEKGVMLLDTKSQQLLLKELINNLSSKRLLV